jgi:hypothetical protein
VLELEFHGRFDWVFCFACELVTMLELGFHGRFDWVFCFACELVIVLELEFDWAKDLVCAIDLGCESVVVLVSVYAKHTWAPSGVCQDSVDSPRWQLSRQSSSAQMYQNSTAQK